jgi:hypoxanthine phosphoribosyltransferase
MSDKIYYSWDQITEACNMFAEGVHDTHGDGKYTRFDAVVGLTRGGLVPGVILSHLFYDIPLIPVDYSSSQGMGDNVGSHSNDVPNIKQHRLLLVDDIIDSGHTMNELVLLLRARGHDVMTYSYIWKEGAVFAPDQYCVKLPADAGWVVFPWE